MSLDALLNVSALADSTAGMDRVELAELWVEADALLTELRAAKEKLTAALAEILDTPLVLADGRVLKPRRQVTRKAWLRPELTKALEAWCGRYLIDPDTGESMLALDAERARAVFEPATGRVSFLTSNKSGPQLTLKEFCEETWTDTIEVVR